jgi:hypothetical protein
VNVLAADVAVAIRVIDHNSLTSLTQVAIALIQSGAETWKAIAWPGAVLVVVLMLRREVGELIGRVQEIPFRGGSIKFGIKEVKQLADEAHLPEAETPAPEVIRLRPPGLLPYLQGVAEVSPRLAIIEAWRRLEGELMDKVTGWRGPGRPTGMRLTEQLLREEVIDPNLAQIIDRLRFVRNKAIHARDFEVSGSDALEYVRTVERVAKKLGLDL